MTSFKKFILESNDVDPKGAAESVFRDCQRFIKGSGFQADDKRTWVYRGMHVSPLTSFRKVESRDRDSKDTHAKIHNTVDKAIQEKTGIPFRSIGTFATGNRVDAIVYGEEHIFFPIGDYDYCWSPVVRDAYEWFDNGVMSRNGFPKVTEEWGFDFKIGDDFDFDHEAYLAAVEKWVKVHGGYKLNRGLKDAVASYHEIMFRCKSYYLIASDFKEKWLSEFLDCLKVIMENKG